MPDTSRHHSTPMPEAGPPGSGSPRLRPRSPPTAPGSPSSEAGPSSSKRRRVEVRVAASPVSPVYSPPSPVPPPPYLDGCERRFSPPTAEVDGYEARVTRRLAMSTPEREAAYAAELARSSPVSTPSPMPSDADGIVGATLERLRPSRTPTPTFRDEVQRLTPLREGASPASPNPRYDEASRTPPPPHPDRHVPSHGEIADWAERLSPVMLLVWLARRFYPADWEVAPGSPTEQWLQRLALLRLTEACMPWPSWQCRRCASMGLPCFASAFANPFGERGRTSRACVQCHLADHSKCVRDIRAFPGMVYAGDGEPATQPRGFHRAERAHLTTAQGSGPGYGRSIDRTQDPVMARSWESAMRDVWRIRPSSLQTRVLRLIQQFVEHHDRLYSERQPHESVHVAGQQPGPDSLREWVQPYRDNLREIEREAHHADHNPFGF